LKQHELQVGRKPIKERTKQPADALPHALNHWIRLEAIAILLDRLRSRGQSSGERHEGEFSAGEVAEIIGEDVRYVTGHIRDLYEAGCIEFVGYKLVGSRMRPVFRAVALPVITDDMYRAMSREERYDTTGAMAQGFLAETLSSYRNRRMDGDEPPCMIWDTPALDAEGRRKLRERLTEVWEKEVLAIQGESANRIAESGEKAIPTVVGLFSFERGRRGRPEGYYRAEKT
jgi:DNA-binding transcriptional ArsR family regulator